MTDPHRIGDVATLRTMLGAAPDPIRRGYRGRLRRARLNLAYALVGQRRGVEALRSVLASLVENPGPAALRDLASVGLGALLGPKR